MMNKLIVLLLLSGTNFSYGMNKKPIKNSFLRESLDEFDKKDKKVCNETKRNTELQRKLSLRSSFEEESPEDFLAMVNELKDPLTLEDVDNLLQSTDRGKTISEKKVCILFQLQKDITHTLLKQKTTAKKRRDKF